jgi:hypothetical protein
MFWFWFAIVIIFELTLISLLAFFMKGAKHEDTIDEALNMWGTDMNLIDPEGFCMQCEREVPYHYKGCPTRVKNQR